MSKTFAAIAAITVLGAVTLFGTLLVNPTTLGVNPATNQLNQYPPGRLELLPTKSINGARYVAHNEGFPYGKDAYLVAGLNEDLLELWTSKQHYITFDGDDPPNRFSYQFEKSDFSELTEGEYKGWTIVKAGVRRRIVGTFNVWFGNPNR